MKKQIIVVIAIYALMCCQPLCAAPFVPETDDQVLERLPLSGNTAANELRRMRKQLQEAPANLALALQLATRYLALARAESDPRYLGYVQAALQPWWDLETPPPEVLLLRATVRQNRHEFAAALSDLERVLERQPRNAQAWLTAAVIHQVRGDYQAAMRHCLALLSLSDSLVATACVSSVASLTGHAERAHAFLRQALEDRGNEIGREERLWVMTLLAEIAVRTGKIQEAGQYFKKALALGSNDAYLLGAYADFLLDQNQADEARNLLKEHTRVDGLLLRLALAEQQLATPGLAERIASLEARFAAGRMRGESLHQGEEARFTLRLLREPAAALRLAQSNWAVQREPRDTRVLLEAASAVGDLSAAAPVLTWLKQNHVEDVRLSALTTQFEHKP
ncbi:MAG: tetratricopeptide repeat protein [Methylococcales bacterium]|nr:tetratricopeptide repeat protein [Methylococcales bacterium]